MPDLVPHNVDNATNPLQPGDPFKRGNFNRFALGMCLLIAVFLLAAIAFFYFGRSHTATPSPSPDRRSTSMLVVVRPAAG